MIVDAHHHLWDLSRGYSWLSEYPPIQRTFTMDDLLPALRKAGVMHTVLVEAGRCESAEVSEFLQISDGYPEIAGVVGWCDIADPWLPSHPRLAGARSQIQGESDPGYLNRPAVRSGLSLLADRGLAFDLVVRVDQLRAAAEAVHATPALTFVLDHLGKPSIRDGAIAEWRAALEPLAAQPNAFAKLSGLVTEADWESWRPADLKPYVHIALELFGPERLMFGSDWPVCLLAASYERVLEALNETLGDLSPADRAAIFAGTAIRAYNLSLTKAC